MAKHEQHTTALVVNQVVEVRQDRAIGGGSLTGPEDSLPVEERRRVAASVHKQYGDPTDPYWHPFRPDALLTPEELHYVYARNADVRSVFNSIERRISTWDHDFLPALDEDDPDYEKAVAQAKAVTRWFDGPLNLDGDTWQIFWTMVVHDALKLWHGVFEHVHREVVDAHGVKQRGFLVEFVPLYGGSIYPVPGNRRRIGGYVQDLGYDGTVRTNDKLIELPARDITSLRLDPNTRSLFGTPLIETAVIQIGTLDRSSNRVFEEFDSEIPPGFLIMSGGSAPIQKVIGEEKKGRHGGKDKRFKILYQKGSVTPAQWLRIERAWKELELAPVVKQAQKTWWRLCGVTPADMGDVEDANRSNMDAQLDVSSSHLIDPLLEGIQSKVNMSMLPLVVQMLAQDRNARVLCKFEFDLTTKLTPEQLKDLEEARNLQRRNGTRSANEVRAEDGLEPYDGGEVFHLDAAVVGSTDGETSAEEADDPDDGDGGGGDGGGERAAPSPEPTPPAEPPAAREPPTRTRPDASPVAAAPEHVHGPGCGHETEQAGSARRVASAHHHDRVATLLASAAVVGDGAKVASLYEVAGPNALRWNLPVRGREPEQLPSDWQPAGRFEDDNTIDLLALFGQVTGYGGVVQPLWDAARAQSLAATAVAFQRGEIGSPLHRDALNQVLAKLQEDWARSTSEIYADTAVSARDAVREFTGEDTIGETKVDNLADLFADVAMGFLAALMASLEERMERAIALLEGNPDAELDELLSEMERGWDANEFRIDMWSGKLVQLANQAAVATLLEASVMVVDEEAGESRADPYYVRWFDTGDDAECPDCIQEGSLGWRPLTTLTRVPGGNVQCTSRCRCVLGWARKSEVV